LYTKWDARRRNPPNHGVGIVTETSMMKKFFYSIKKQNTLSVIYVIKSYTQALVFLYIVCRYIKKLSIEFQTRSLIGGTLK